jgi:hypothetical protein
MHLGRLSEGSFGILNMMLLASTPYFGLFSCNLMDGWHFRAVGIIILRISHGYRPKNENVELVRIVDTVTGQLNIHDPLRLFAVDFLPILRHIPEWFSGGGFGKIAREWRQNHHST